MNSYTLLTSHFDNLIREEFFFNRLLFEDLIPIKILKINLIAQIGNTWRLLKEFLGFYSMLMSLFIPNNVFIFLKLLWILLFTYGISLQWESFKFFDYLFLFI